MKMLGPTRCCSLISKTTHLGRNSLQVAGKFNSSAVLLQMCEFLGDSLFNVAKVTNNDGWTALHVVTKYQKEDVVQNFINLFTSSQLAELLSIVDSLGVTPFHLGVCIQTHDIISQFIKILGDKAIDIIKIQDEEGHNSFHSALIYQEWETVLLFIDLLGENLKEFLLIEDLLGLTPLHLAIHHENSNMSVDFIEYYQKYDINISEMKTKRNCTILHEVVHYQPPDVVTKYISVIGEKLSDIILDTDNEAYTALHVAAHYQDLEIIKLLVASIPTTQQKACLRSPECDGWTSIHYGAKHQDISFFEYITDILQDQTAKAILQTDNFDCTPFHLACKYQNSESLRFIIKQIETYIPSVSTKKRSDGNTPLHLATRFQPPDVLEYFTKLIGSRIRKAIEVKNQSGRTVLHVAARSKNLDVLMLLLDALGEFAKDVVLIEDNNQMTPLHLIAKNHGTEVLEIVLSRFRQSGLYLIRRALSKSNCSRPIIALLMRMNEEKAKVEIQTEHNGETAVHLAAGYHSQAIVGSLLSKLSDKEISSIWQMKNKKGFTCAQLSKKNRVLKGNKSWEIYHTLRFDAAQAIQFKDRANINVLDFSYLPFNRQIIDAFVGFSFPIRALKKINFRSCKLTDNLFQLIIPCIANQTQLETLILADNQISNAQPLFDILDKLPNLKTINLQYNWIMAPENQFLKIPSKVKKYALRQIDVSSNFIFSDEKKESILVEKKISATGAGNSLEEIVTKTRFCRGVFISTEETVASILNPLHGTDTKHWHVMLCCSKTRERAKIFLEGMHPNGQRFLRSIRVPHFKVSRNIKAVNRNLPLVTLNLSKYRGKSWAISREQGLSLLQTVRKEIVLDADSKKNILHWGISLLAGINIRITEEVFNEDFSKNQKNCLIM